MIIDSKKATIRLKLYNRALFVLLFSITIILFFSFNFYYNGLMGYSFTIWISFFLFIYAAYFSFGLIRNYYYFFYNDMGQKLVFRYYSLAHFSKRLQAVEIKKATFYKFEFRKKLLGLQSYVILYQKVAQNIAKYPPISVSLLSKRQRNELVTSLTMFQKVQ